MTDTSHFEKCRKTMRWLKRNQKIRFVVTVFSLVINSMMYFLHMFTNATLIWSPQNSYLSFVFLLASLVVGGFVLYLAASASASPEKPNLLCLLLGVLVVAVLTKIILNVFGFLILLWATQLLECKKAKWLTDQPGYPYFNERFEQQKQSNEYVPDHLPDSSTQASCEMPEIPDIPELPDQ